MHSEGDLQAFQPLEWNAGMRHIMIMLPPQVLSWHKTVCRPHWSQLPPYTPCSYASSCRPAKSPRPQLRHSTVVPPQTQCPLWAAHLVATGQVCREDVDPGVPGSLAHPRSHCQVLACAMEASQKCFSRRITGDTCKTSLTMH